MNNRKIALYAVLIGSIINAATVGVSKLGLYQIPPLSFASLRFFLAALCILPFFLLYKKGNAKKAFNSITPISLLASCNIIFFTIGLSFTTANTGGMLYASVPVLVGIIGYLFFKQRLKRTKILGVLVGFVGVVLITVLPLVEVGNPFSGNLFANILIMIGVILWSFYMVLIKRQLELYSPVLVLSNLIFVTALMLLPFFIWDASVHNGWWGHVTWEGIFSLLYVAIFTTVLCYGLNQYAIKLGGSVFASVTFYIMPVLAFAINYWLLGEQLTPLFMVGTILALVGTYLVMRK
jgi:drug/metabolite transporter (DMT)-like permease